MRARKEVSFVVAAVTLAALLFTMITPEASADWPGDKAGRGVVNIFLSPAEIPVSIIKWTREKGPGTGLSIGLIAGIVNGVERMGAGAFELITFVVPPYDQPFYDYELGESRKTIWE